MKNIKLIIGLIMIVLYTGCTEDFLDVNEDPNNPSVASMDLVLAGVTSDLGYLHTADREVDAVLSVYVHQITTRENHDKYATGGSKFEIGNSWDDTYLILPELETLITNGTATKNLHVAGMAKIMKAWVFQQGVDLWGAIPYEEATKFSDAITAPNFTDDKEIYASLLLLLDEAIADLKNENPEEATNLLDVSDFDLFFGAKTENWIKAANTLKFKMYLNMNKAEDKTAELQALIDGGELMTSADDDWEYWFTEKTTPDERHPLYAGEYGGAQTGFYISPWFYEILKGRNENIFSGINDPRVPYLFCRQINDPADAENPLEYGTNDGFASIYFASDGINRDHGGRSTFTLVGMYPCGGQYDDGRGGKLDADDANGAGFKKIMNYADLLYMQAELFVTNELVGDAKATFTSAMTESFGQIDDLVAHMGDGAADRKGVAVKGVETADAAAYITAVLAEYDAASDEKKLEIIMTQKWIYGFMHGVDQYTDYRRTGYPVLFDPATMSDFADGGPAGSGPVPTSISRDYQRLLPYYQGELEKNANSPIQRVDPNERVFWDVVK